MSNSARRPRPKDVEPAVPDPDPQPAASCAPAGLVVKCPTCRREVPWREDSQWRPFCSARCQGIDLGAWASNRYVIPGQPAPDEAGDGDWPQDDGHRT